MIFLSTLVKLPFWASSQQKEARRVLATRDVFIRDASLHEIEEIEQAMDESPISKGGMKEVFEDVEEPNLWVWAKMNYKSDSLMIESEMYVNQMVSALSSLIPNSPKLYFAPVCHERYENNSAFSKLSLAGTNAAIMILPFPL